MVQFQPIMVTNKTDLDSVTIVDGQYIVVIDTNEIYIDKDGARTKVSGANVTIGMDAPGNPTEGDIWIVTSD